FALPVAFVAVTPDALEQPFGVDFVLYRDVAARWLAGGPYFEPYQVAGIYEIRAGDVLYPPAGLWLFVPFAVLPAVAAWLLWWGLPLGAVAWAIVRLRPRPEVWPLIALCIAWPTTPLKTWTGNPVIWSVAALALGTLYRWPSVFVLIKPSLGVFAAFGANRRSWWVALAVLVALCLPFGSLWPDWLASLANSRGGGLLYSALEVPMLLIPLVAWLGRTRPAPAEAAEAVEAAAGSKPDRRPISYGGGNHLRFRQAISDSEIGRAEAAAGGDGDPARTGRGAARGNPGSAGNAGNAGNAGAASPRGTRPPDPPISESEIGGAGGE
ncbi:MAG TPA: glycosyltransferase family 87 protein, partial [Candidatus Limnocylindrales bacterium]|nr:glycosyltransferase family 87 protein [Candidatus Limnocylindrales bacterium]